MKIFGEIKFHQCSEVHHYNVTQEKKIMNETFTKKRVGGKIGKNFSLSERCASGLTWMCSYHNEGARIGIL